MRKLTEEDENYIRENIKYDSETGYLWWNKLPEGKYTRRLLDKPAGFVHNTEGYVLLNLRLPSGTTVCRAHRIAWFLYYGSWPKDLLDHINGIKDDNKIKNLREATKNQNEMNKKKRSDCSSKYKGVCWSKEKQKWTSYIRINRRRKHLGVYASEEEAAGAYDKAARKLFGEYAFLNFPDEHEQGALNGHDV